ncbi:transmembrane protein 202 isoform X2 [Tachyglossus aculeatus]|uniref:transmembrane protein 202 isoform X2 n=1 Tax=Tachyglossus aculeatus TaxID=9261 RepID=UPI0018F450DB|nr:transmembrane protein 202 isoform X2 [Tachyglossus aculeatus]
MKLHSSSIASSSKDKHFNHPSSRPQRLEGRGEFPGCRWLELPGRRLSTLPLSRRLLHRARPVSRGLAAACSLAATALLTLGALHGPWLRFLLTVDRDCPDPGPGPGPDPGPTPGPTPGPPNRSACGTPARPVTFHVYTKLWTKCRDSSCLRETYEGPYYLEASEIFMLIAISTSLLLSASLLFTTFILVPSNPAFDLFTSAISFFSGQLLPAARDALLPGK